MSSGIIDWADTESGLQLRLRNRDDVALDGDGPVIQLTLVANPGETWGDEDLHRFLTPKAARAMSAALRLMAQPDSIGTAAHQQAEEIGRVIGQAVRQQQAAIAGFVEGLTAGLNTTDTDQH